MTHNTTRRLFLQRAAATGLGLAWGAKQVLADPGQPNGLPYAAAEIAGRLGISMAVFQAEQLAARHVSAIRELGIQRIELTMMPPRFDFRDRRQVKEVLDECRKQDVSVVSVHGNLQRKYNDPVEDKRRAAAAALLDEIRFSEEAGAGILVAHFGTDDPARETVTELLDKTQDLRIRLTVENIAFQCTPTASSAGTKYLPA